ncbi:MAG: hypothetical protein BWK72_04560 [Rhodoferax ferrireducens]|uniref:Uncharacterized protein n=1 Tax=Rhodoferax ferrireducens TaxID=192843 RepID=A0A1W9KX96_9BURK|nr:MAG: hypothetical protein BWK72_04560 [Rhodoferax ferrireducens]
MVMIYGKFYLVSDFKYPFVRRVLVLPAARIGYLTPRMSPGPTGLRLNSAASDTQRTPLGTAGVMG